MPNTGFSRIVESGVFEWPWTSPHGLVVITGAAGGGGGGGKGYETGAAGAAGANGFDLFIPVCAGDDGDR